MVLDMMVDFDTDKGEFNGPNVNVTNNNGLGMTADLLEEVFTNKDFPKKAPSLAVSKRLGQVKSRFMGICVNSGSNGRNKK